MSFVRKLYDDIFQGQGVEVRLDNDEDFLKIRETLTRIGTPEGQENPSLSQICYILHKRGRYIIAHFKELMSLDGILIQIDESDIAMRNTISCLLEDWDLLEISNPDGIEELQCESGAFKVISHKDKWKWNLISPYRIGIDKRPIELRQPSLDPQEHL